MEKKKALRKAAVLKPKGNGINDSLVRWACVYAVVFWQLLFNHRRITAATFAAFLSIDFTKDNAA